MSQTRSPQGELSGLGRTLSGPFEDLPYFAFVALTLAAACTVRAQLGVPVRLKLVFYADWLLTIAFIYVAIRSLAILFAWKFRYRRRLLESEVWRRIGSRLFDPPRLVNFLVIFFTIPAVMTVFTIYKANIPDIQPFNWDVRLAELDRWLHFGRDPWTILQPVLGHPLAIWIVDKAYALWFPVLWVTFIWQAWHGSPATSTRSQYLLAFAACWILLGNVAATYFSSAGPVYYGRVTGQPDPFVPLVDHLLLVDATTPFRLRAVWAHDYLWREHLNPAVAVGDGISAMPSLHISMVVLLSLVGFRENRCLGWAYTAFGFLIFIGSISLAWHYAVDAYVALIGTLAIWGISGWLVRRWREHPLVQSLVNGRRSMTTHVDRNEP